MTKKEYILDFLKEINYAYNHPAMYDDLKRLLDEMEEEILESAKQSKIGQWIKNAEEWQNVDPPYICSECGRASLRQENFCCSCGADMRGDADEGNN